MLLAENEHIFLTFQKSIFPTNPDTAWHGIFMTRHDTPKHGMARYAKIWHGTWNHDMAWRGTGPPCRELEMARTRNTESMLSCIPH